MAAVPPENTLLYDVGVSALASGVALGLLRFWEELAKRGVFEQVEKRSWYMPWLHLFRVESLEQIWEIYLHFEVLFGK